MRSLQITLGSIVLSLLVGCLSPTTLTREEIQTRRNEQRMRSYGLTFHYCGSKGGFDYFRGFNPNAGSSLGREEWYKVPENQQAVAKRFPFTKNSKEWRFYEDGLRRGGW